MKPAPATSASDLPFLIVALSLGFQALLKRLRTRAGLSEDVAVGMGSIFFALYEAEDGACIMKDLGARLRMPKGTLSGLLGRMEQMGMVERSPCPEDGRAQRLRLTRKGRAMAPGLQQRHRQAIEILESGLSDREAATLKKLLGRVLGNLHFDEDSAPAVTGKPARKSGPLAQRRAVA